MPINYNRSSAWLLTHVCGSFIAATLLFGCADDTTTDPHVDVCAHWEYTGDAGAEHWKDCATYADCGGQAQSPVNITGATVDASLTDIAIIADSSKSEITNNGHTLQMTDDGGAAINFNGKRYDLLQFHFHTPSEHTMNGTSYPMEVHLVHKDSAGQLAVIGILFEEGTENPMLARYSTKWPLTANGKFVDSTMHFLAADLLPSSRNYYTYSGSLTTPPCSQIVTWLVMKQPIQASKAQLDAIKAIEHTNNRPIQALNGRVIRSKE